MAFRPTQALPAARLPATVAERSRSALMVQQLPAPAWPAAAVALLPPPVWQQQPASACPADTPDRWPCATGRPDNWRWRLAGPPAVSFFCQPPDGSSQVPAVSYTHLTL